jgi:hypothetical protein
VESISKSVGVASLLLAAALSADNVNRVHTASPLEHVADLSGNVAKSKVDGSASSMSGGGPGDDVSSETGAPATTADNSRNENVGAIARDLSQAPLFALTSGLASILGLLLTLYATQVRTIPFSFYRSLMWRKALLLSIGTGFLVFGGMKFYSQTQAPFLSPFREIHSLLVGEYRVSAWDHEPHGSVIWAILFLLGGILLITGLFYDPAATARRILVREQDALHKALDDQISHLLRGRKAAALEPPDNQILADTLEYYRHIEWRFADVVLGAPPPAFPLFYQRHQQSAGDV